MDGARSLIAAAVMGYDAQVFRKDNERFHRSFRDLGSSAMYTPAGMQVFAILPAAGLGTRMAGLQPKQFLALNGIPILIHSLRAFASVERVTAIYVAVRKPEMERAEAQAAEYGLAGKVRVVEGG